MNTRARVAELHNFGLAVGAIVAGLFGLAVPWAHHRPVPVWPWALGLTLAACAAVAPALLRYPYLVWNRVGRALRWVNSRIVLNLLFFLIFVPAGVVARLTNWDPMKRRFEPAQPTYRVSRGPVSPTSMEKPY